MAKDGLTCDIFLPLFPAPVLTLILPVDDHFAGETPLRVAAEVSLKNFPAFFAFFVAD